MGDKQKAPGDANGPGAQVITGSEPGSFAHGVLAERHPALIRRVREALPYGPRQHLALDALMSEITRGVVEPLGPHAPDRELWLCRGREHYGRPWFDAPFLWAESYFYRRLLAAVDYFTDGPWRGVDPFAPFKDLELRDDAVDDELRALDDLAAVPADERARALLYASLWGNRADLGFSAASDGPLGDAVPGLVADDSALLWELLPVGAPATVSLIADNTGRELIPDLVLLDHLLGHGHAERAVLYVKPYPYYVSDATTADAVACLRRLMRAPGEAGAIGTRLWAAMGSGSLEVRTHAFFCAPLPYEDMPGDLRQDLRAGTVTILKGDLNYRRLVGDRLWDATSPFADRTASFPGAVAALRTLKSDVVVGLGPRMWSTLEESGRDWRTGGTHALIQVRA
ncbi:damage-control phosphatase ARMT1 family protein [Streptomyces sp. NPDC005899]|uniref:damage-control phosphatase ARMT1 family protein n=1 Tax=Streptomyces sp. NPDC005899 TaxID=3155716 RepID=UPI0033F78845